VSHNRKRLPLKVSLDRRLRFETVLEDLLLALARPAACGATTEVDASLRRAARAVGLDDVWLWTFGDPHDPNWSSRALLSGASTICTLADELPYALRRSLADRPPGSWSVAATPLHVGALALGALFWVSFQHGATWPADRLEQLRILSVVFADHLERQRASDSLAESNALRVAILRSLPGHVAVLDRRGTIIAVNQSWANVWSERESSHGDTIGPGVNFLDVCAAAARAGAAGAADALGGVESVCNGLRPDFELEYGCVVAGDERWFRMTVTPLRLEDGGAVVAHADITDYRRAQDALRDVSGRLIGAQEQERARIGRELHDNVSQRLALLSIKIDEIRKALPASAGKIAARIANLRAESRAVAHEVHDLSHRLHSIKLEALGLVAAVQAHCRELSQYGVQVQFSSANVPAILSDDAALCVFRVVQEALANVVKHSGAANARVVLSGGDSEIVLRVEDSGLGFEPDTQSRGLGLISMRERVRLLGGDLTIRSTPLHGTVIEARVPAQVSRRQAGRSLPAA